MEFDLGFRTSSTDDSVQCLRFSPPTVQATYLIAGSWDNNVRCWEIKGDGSSEPKSQQSMQVQFSFPYKVFYQMAISAAVQDWYSKPSQMIVNESR